MPDNFPIVIVAPTKREAYKAAVSLALPYPPGRIVLIGNGSIRDTEGLRAERYHTFYVDPERISYKILRALDEIHSLYSIDINRNRIAVAPVCPEGELAAVYETEEIANDSLDALNSVISDPMLWIVEKCVVDHWHIVRSDRVV